MAEHIDRLNQNSNKSQQLIRYRRYLLIFLATIIFSALAIQIYSYFGKFELSNYNEISEHQNFLNYRGHVETGIYSYLISQLNSVELLKKFIEPILFFLVLSAKLILVGALAGFIFGYSSFGAWKGKDFLGQLGNGRSFYSGVKFSLNSDNEPQATAPGLVALRFAPNTKIAIELQKILEKYQAASKTNQELAAVIGAESAQPAWPDSTISLGEATVADLSWALALWKKEISLPEILPLNLSHDLSELSVETVAAAVLALRSGAILNGDNQEGTSSMFPELSARAVLHSIPSFHQEFSWKAKMIIRRGLVYSSRKGYFAPPRLPLGLGNKTRALRQVLEYLIPAPNLRAGNIIQLKAFGLTRELAERFAESLKPQLENKDKEIFQTIENVWIVPAEPVIQALIELRKHDEKSWDELGQKATATSMAINTLGLEKANILAQATLIFGELGWFSKRLGSFQVPFGQPLYVKFERNQTISLLGGLLAIRPGAIFGGNPELVNRLDKIRILGAGIVAEEVSHG